MNNIRRNHPPAFKAQVVLALLKEEQTASEVCSQFNIHPTQAKQWKTKAMENLSCLFDDNKSNKQVKEKDHLIEELYKQVGQLKVELDWLKKKMGYPTTWQTKAGRTG